MGGISTVPIPDIHVPLTSALGVEKSHFETAAKRAEIDRVNRELIGIYERATE